MSLKSIGKLALTLAAGVAGMCTAHADITLTFQWSGSVWEDGFTGGDAQSDDAIGIYAFNTAGTTGITLPNTIYSVCLSPLGLLDGNTHTYNQETFAQASPGIFPSQWASGVVHGQTQDWGICNAAYLWHTFGMNIVDQTTSGLHLAGNASEEGCALQFAIWNVLYNSTAYGQSSFSSAGYSAPFAQFDASEQQDYNAYINALLNAGPNMPIYNGSILQGTGAPGDGPNGGDDQEFFLLGEPTPEPSTIVAGAMMLVPLGVGAVRKFRKGSSNA